MIGKNVFMKNDIVGEKERVRVEMEKLISFNTWLKTKEQHEVQTCPCGA